MKFRSLDHFLTCAYADEVHVMAGHEYFKEKDRCKKGRQTLQK